MMKTKLKTMIGALHPNTGKGNRVQPKFTLRKFLAVCLLAMVAQAGLAGDWSGNAVTYDFTEYHKREIADFLFSFDGQSKVSSVRTYRFDKNQTVEIYLLVKEDHLGNQLAVEQIGGNGIQDSEKWQVKTISNTSYLYQNRGERIFSILNLYAGTKVTITYTGTALQFNDNNQVTNIVNEGTTVTSGKEYEIRNGGSLDLKSFAGVQIEKVKIDYVYQRLSFTGQTGYTSSGYVDGIPYYRYRLSSRRFDEPVPSVFPAGSGSYDYEYSVANYGSSVGGKEVAVMSTSTNGDILFKNLGWCQVTVIAKQNGTEVARGSYLVEVWDNEAYYIVDKNSNGVPYKYRFAKDPAITDDNQQGGVLKSRTVTAVEGMEMKFGIPEDVNLGEPNTAVVYKHTIGGTDHMVSFINNDEGWWDRLPNNNWTSPDQGTFYSFKATASGKLRFGGVKPFQNNDSSADDYRSTAGKVYLVKIVSGYPQTEVFTAGQSGYLESGEINMEAGVIYFLQGENNGTTQTPFLLEWFSYETDLKVSKTFGVASKPGSEIGNSETITTDAQVTLNGTAASSSSVTLEYDRKGNISSATVALNSSGYITISNINFSSDSQKGGAIKVKIKNGDSFIEYVYTIPYGKHVWDFRNSDDQDEASRVTDPSYTDAELCSNMKANTSDWSRVYKVHSKSGGSWSDLKDPLMVAGSKIEGDNAFYMSNTAGLIFVTNDIESFGAQQTANSYSKTITVEGESEPTTITYNDLSIDDQYLLGYETISETNLVWMKGTSTIYFPGVKPNQYIKIYTYRHADDKGERFYVRNLVDLDGKPYNRNPVDESEAWESGTDATHFIKIRGATNEDNHDAIIDDYITGAAIFRVPNSYEDTNVLSEMPSLTLCDDGWVKIFRIEIMSNYEPDLVLRRDKKEGETQDDFVTYDSRSSSVVLRKKNGVITSVTNYYTGTPGNVRSQHANTPKYQVVADEGVSVTATIENSQSPRHVDYNRLKLLFSGGNGNVKIIQREVANIAGSGVVVGHDVVEVEGVKTYPDRAPVALGSGTGLNTGDYVIDKNEYRISVGELTVQDYPYTWDLTNYNFGKNATTESNMKNSNTTTSWKWTGTWPSMTLTATGTKQMGENAVSNPNNDPLQELNNTVPLFTQGAELKTRVTGSPDVTTPVAECVGLGISQPLASTTKSIYLEGSKKDYTVYNTSSEIALGGSGTSYKLTNAGEITIPEVDNNMYIFVKATNNPTVRAEWTVVSTDPVTEETTTSNYSQTLSILTGNDDIFSVADGVRLYKNTTGHTADIYLNFPASTGVEIVAVTNIEKGLDRLGYATESRDRAIDHTYESKLTNNNVEACIVTAADEAGNPYNYKGFPSVMTSPTEVVPAYTGIVLRKNNHPEGSSTLPLFVPAVNLVPAANVKSSDPWPSNLMIPNVFTTRHYSEEATFDLSSSITGTSINTLIYTIEGSGPGTPDWNVNVSETTIFGYYDTAPNRYVDLSAYTELRIYQTKGEPVRCFFYNSDGSDYVIINTTSSPVALEWVNGVNGYYSLDLTKLANKKLIAIKASAYNTKATVSDIKVNSSSVVPEGTKYTKFVMGPSYFVYDKISETSSSVQEVDWEAFYRMRLDTDPSTAATNNTLAANKALLAIPTSSLPIALWNGGNGEGTARAARKGVIYIDLQDIDEGDATGIDVPFADVASEDAGQKTYYTLSGIKINGKPTVKGIYICNGKKVSVK